jgi:prevent-host-death family protein
MRAAGIREIKDRFSEYLRIVAEGEVVLVTDRGKVVAQIAPPPVHAPQPSSEEDALRRLALAGKIRLPAARVPSPGAEGVPGVPRGVDIAGMLAEVRGERLGE